MATAPVQVGSIALSNNGYRHSVALNDTTVIIIGQNTALYPVPTTVDVYTIDPATNNFANAASGTIGGGTSASLQFTSHYAEKLDATHVLIGISDDGNSTGYGVVTWDGTTLTCTPYTVGPTPLSSSENAQVIGLAWYGGVLYYARTEMVNTNTNLSLCLYDVTWNTSTATATFARTATLVLDPTKFSTTGFQGVIGGTDGIYWLHSGYSSAGTNYAVPMIIPFPSAAPPSTTNPSFLSTTGFKAGSQDFGLAAPLTGPGAWVFTSTGYQAVTADGGTVGPFVPIGSNNRSANQPNGPGVARKVQTDYDTNAAQVFGVFGGTSTASTLLLVDFNTDGSVAAGFPLTASGTVGVGPRSVERLKAYWIVGTNTKLYAFTAPTPPPPPPPPPAPPPAPPTLVNNLKSRSPASQRPYRW